MATQVQFRGGSSSEHSSFTGAAREVTVDTTKNALVVHDGSTPGGHLVAPANSPDFTGNVDINGNITLNADGSVTADGGFVTDGTTFSSPVVIGKDNGTTSSTLRANGDLLLGGDIAGGNPNITLSNLGSGSFAGDVNIGDRNPASNTAAGIRLTVESGATGVYAQATNAVIQSTNAFQALKGTTEVFSVDYSGAAEFRKSIEVNDPTGSYSYISTTGFQSVLEDSALTSGTAAFSVSPRTNPTDYKVVIAGDGSSSFASRITTDASLVFKGTLNAPDTGLGEIRVGTTTGPELTTGGRAAPISLFTGNGATDILHTSFNSDGSITTAGDITCSDNSKGLVLKSPDGTSFRLSVANDGTLSASAV